LAEKSKNDTSKKRSGFLKIGGFRAKKMLEGSSMLAGATAGFVSRIICHPIDTIKAKMQVRVRLPRRES